MTTGDSLRDDRPLRIAFFSDSMLPVLNGVSISIDTLVGQLRNLGHSVHLFGPEGPPPPGERRRRKETDPNIHRFPAVETPFAKGYPIAYPPFYPMLSTFRKYTFDIIHTHTPFIVGFVGLRWAESHEIPIVSTYHTLYDRYAHYLPIVPRRYSRFRIAKHTNYYYNTVQHVITPSEASLKWLRRHDVHTPTTIIPTATATPQRIDRDAARIRLGFQPNQRILLYVGRLAREKNLDTLLEACAIALSANQNLRLVLVGDGPYRDSVTDLARKLGIGDRVQFAGFVPRIEVDIYYAAADLFVFTSITETQGLVLQEAMRYGLPSVTVFGGGASEVIVEGENGIVSKNDPIQFASDVIRTVTDSSLLNKLQVGASRSAEEHSITAMADQVLAVYRGVLHG